MEKFRIKKEPGCYVMHTILRNNNDLIEQLKKVDGVKVCIFTSDAVQYEFIFDIAEMFKDNDVLAEVTKTTTKFFGELEKKE